MNHWALPDIKLSSGARQKHYLTMRRDITTRCYIHYTSKSHSAKHILFLTNTLLTGMMRLTQHSLFYKKFTTTLFIPQCICDKLLYFYISQKRTHDNEFVVSEWATACVQDWSRASIWPLWLKHKVSVHAIPINPALWTGISRLLQRCSCRLLASYSPISCTLKQLSQLVWCMINYRL